MPRHNRLAGGGLELFAPAKVNLFLEVGKKRHDGYHDLISLVQKVALFDRIAIIPSDKSHFLFDTSPYGEENIVARAYRLFEKTLGKNLSFQITLQKKIPIEAGLGGGSSNAAAILWGLNELLDRPFSREGLHRLGEKIGSDVPLFLYDSPVVIAGRGEKVFPYLFPHVKEVSLIVPSFGLSTQAVYGALASQRSPIDEYERLERVMRGEWSYFNDLEEAAFSLRPELRTLKESLETLGFEKVMMSGSGSTLFCLGKSKRPLEEWVRKEWKREEREKIAALSPQIYTTQLLESG